MYGLSSKKLLASRKANWGKDKTLVKHNNKVYNDGTYSDNLVKTSEDDFQLDQNLDNLSFTDSTNCNSTCSLEDFNNNNLDISDTNEKFDYSNYKIDNYVKRSKIDLLSCIQKELQEVQHQLKDHIDKSIDNISKVKSIEIIDKESYIKQSDETFYIPYINIKDYTAKDNFTRLTSSSFISIVEILSFDDNILLYPFADNCIDINIETTELKFTILNDNNYNNNYNITGTLIKNNDNIYVVNLEISSDLNFPLCIVCKHEFK